MSKESKGKKTAKTEADIEKIIGKPVAELPPSKKFGRRNTTYDRILESIMKKPKGFYPIDHEAIGKPMKSIYAPLDQRIKKDKLPLKIRVRSGKIYIEKTD